MARWEAEGWPFFVKNLENVQGDERDVIFISTTFGKAPGTDKVSQNFGPISRSHGWRRLNVLFTRAKRRIELFTSMSAEDIASTRRPRWAPRRCATTWISPNAACW
jgi:superfamily I DNA and/or RNA helicase